MGKSEQMRLLRPCHLFRKLVVYTESLVNVFFYITSTIMVVPMFKVVCQSLRCTDGHLNVAPSVVCFQGSHWIYVCVLAVVGPLYLFLLLPFAVVTGDPYFVPRSTLRSTEMWRAAARRKATDVNMGFLHRVPARAFHSLWSETTTKILLPAITTLITKGIWQMSVVCALFAYAY